MNEGNSFSDVVHEDFSPVKKEEEIFTLLFKECNINNTGFANIDSLVNYIQQMLPDSPQKGEDIYDSDESVHEAQYNLDLLRCMLVNHSVNGEIDESSYNHVIRNWVRDVRSRSESPNSAHSLELSQISLEEEESQDGVRSSLFQESFETTGGRSSANEADHTQLMNTISDLQLDNKRLQERNQHLLQQMEGIEEAARQVQVTNSDLNVKLKSHQQTLNQLDVIKKENTELSQKLIDDEKQSLELKEIIDTMQQEILGLQSEISELQNQLTSFHSDKEDLEQENRTLQHLLSQKEERVAEIEKECASLAARLDEQNYETISLQQELTNTTETIDELRLENSSLHHRLSEQPSSSTPFRPLAPSLHEELAQSGIADSMSPMTVANSSMEEIMDSLSEEKGKGLEFSDILAQSKSKFEEKASLMRKELSDLIDTPLTSVGSGDKNKTESFVNTKEDVDDVFEAKLRKLETTKRRDRQRAQKLAEEVENLKKENEELKELCRQLQERLERIDTKEHVTDKVCGNDESSLVGAPSDVHLLLTSEPSTGTLCSTSQEEGGIEEVVLSPLDQLVCRRVSTNNTGIQTDDFLLHNKQDDCVLSLATSPTDSGFYSGFSNESAPPTLSDYHALQSEVVHLREQLEHAQAPQSRESTPTKDGSRESTPISEEEKVEQFLVQEESIRVQQVPVENVIYQRRPLSRLQVFRDNIPPVTPKRSCLPLLANLLYSTLKTSIWGLFFLILIFLLIIVMVGVNSTLGRCGGRLCSHSPLHMLFGQHLLYTHTGDVAV